MMPLLNFIGSVSGLINAIFIPTFCYFCWRRNENFEFEKNTLSDCGGSKKTAKVFNLSVILASILQIIFIISVINHFSLSGNLLIFVTGIIVGLSLLICGVVPNNSKLKILHNIFGFTVVILSMVWLFIFNLSLLKINPSIGYISTAISGILTIGTAALFLKYKVSSTPEIFFMGMIIIWNLLFTFVLFFM